MINNLIPQFEMREARLKVNDVPKIHIESKSFTNESNYIVSKANGNGTDIWIPMQLDGTFLYFPTKNITQEENDNCEYIKTVYLTPDAV